MKNFSKKNKRGNLLTENIIFIILNILFLIILSLFITSKVENAALLEEKYAKEIALMIDSSEPIMSIKINMEDAIKIAEKENIDLDRIVLIEGNNVVVRLREKGGYSYSFFNDVTVHTSLDYETKEYRLVIDKYNSQNGNE